MYLSGLRVADLRCLERATIEPAAGINLVTGDNASGKSSLLEAVYMLARGQSFRRSAGKRVVRRGAEELVVHGTIADHHDGLRSVGVAHSGSGCEIRLDGRYGASVVELVRALPVQMIDPNLHRLLEDGPGVRRRYLDWGVFHVEHGFHAAWRRYRRALLQRNRALRQGAEQAAIAAWQPQLVAAAGEVDAARQRYVAALEQTMRAMVGPLLDEGAIALDYHPGWPQSRAFEAALESQLEADRRAGFTQAGPHRADLRVGVGDERVRAWVSRGQQKLLSAGLLAAQAALLTQWRGVRPILLVDDIAAELGHGYRLALLEMIESLGIQCFVTFLQPELIPEGLRECRMFHVEHGRVSQRH